MDTTTSELEKKRDELFFKNMDPVSAAFNLAAQGLTFGWADELGAGLAATVTSPFSKRTFDEIYEREIEKSDQRLEASKEKLGPVLGTLTEIAGGLPTGLTFYKAGNFALKNAPRLARIMGIGAAEGALYGAGVAGEEGKEEGAVRGGGFGAALGPVGAGIGNVGGRIIDKAVMPLYRAAAATPKGEATRILTKQLDRDGISVTKAQEELDKLGPEAMVADLQGNVQGLARAVAQEPGKAKAWGETLLHNRQRSQQQRVLKTVGVDPDDVGSFRMNITQLVNNRKTQAVPFYNRAYETVLDPFETKVITTVAKDGSEREVRTSLNEILEVIPKSFINKAKNLMRGDMDLLEEIKKRFPDTPEGRAAAQKEFQNVDTNSLQFYDYLKRQIDEVTALKTRHGAMAEVRNLMGQKKRLVAYLDEASPDYKKAREIFSGEKELRSAVEYGRSLMSSKTDLAEVEIAIEAMSAGEKTFLRQGIIRGLVDKLESTKEMSNFANNLVDTRRMRELLGHAFPNQDEFNKFINNMVAENRFSYTRQYVLGGSNTAPRIAGQNDLAKEKALAEALKSGQPIAMGIAMLKEIVGNDVAPEVLEALGNMLFRDKKIPKSIYDRIAPKTRGLATSTGVLSTAVIGEKMRDDIGGNSSTEEPESVLFQ